MMVLKVLFIVTISLPWSLYAADKYCQLCEDHTMCKYKGIGPDCEADGDFGVTPEEQQEILDVHNSYRSLVASGSETRGITGPQPKAADMNKIVWDEDLAKVAQRWADQCTFEHDKCRNDPRWVVGQNIHLEWEQPRTPTINWTEAIFGWTGEVTKFNSSEVNSHRPRAEIGHYTQVVWHDTSAIGCGRRSYEDKKIYVCNYGPSGNWIGEPVYTIGEPCSKCSEGLSCIDYLCAKPEVNPRNRNKLQKIPNSPARKKSHHSEPSRKPALVEVKEVDNLNPSHKRRGEDTDLDFENTYTSDPVDHTEQGEKSGFFRPTSNHQLMPNSIENPPPLDPEFRIEIEEIKLKIEKLIRKVIRKVTEKH